MALKQGIFGIVLEAIAAFRGLILGPVPSSSWVSFGVPAC